MNSLSPNLITKFKESPAGGVIREMFKIRLAKFSFGIIFIVLLAGLFSPQLSPKDPFKIDPLNSQLLNNIAYTQMQNIRYAALSIVVM